MGIGIPANSEVPRTASEWLIALGERPDDDRLSTLFQDWLAADPAHAVDWAEINRTLRVIDLTEPGRRAAWDGAFASRTGPRRPSHQGQRWAVGIVAVAAAFVALVTGPQFVLRMQADHVTGAGEQRTVRLADGSIVRLAPQSAIAIARGGDGRRIELLKGEAFFDVVHDDEHPFAVCGGNVTVTDIGTAFDVRLGGTSTDIAVSQGEVRVDSVQTRGHLSDSLTAGGWIRIAADGGVERGRTAPEEVAAWTQGQLVAKNRPVAEVVDELRPYFAGMVVLRGDALARQPLTGVYNLSDPLEALQAVARAQGASVHRITPWIVVISGR